MTNVEVKWSGRSEPTIAEAAEALGISTELVMAVMKKGEDYHALYTPNYPPDTTVHSVPLTRDSSGVLQTSAVPTAHPGMWEELERQMRGGA